MTHRLLTLIVVAVAMLSLVACGAQTTTEPPTVATTAPLNGGEDSPTAATESATAPTAEAPTAEAAPIDTPAAAPDPTATAEVAVDATLCPELTRPALIATVGSGFEAVNPQSGERCSLPLPETAAYLQPAGDSFYFELVDYDAAQSVVARVGPAGVVEPLEATRAEGDVHYLSRFAVSPDATQMAWTAMNPQEETENGTALQGSMWVGAAGGSDPLTILDNQSGGQLRIITPIRFSADGSTLFFTWEPNGIGGSWLAFNGRYDNLYRVPVTGGQAEKMFDCGDGGWFLCIGDFLDDGTLAYIDADRVIHVAGPDLADLATIPTAADYAGYPTFSPTGDLVYSEATLPADTLDVPLPAPGSVYRLAAPYTGAPELVATADGLLTSAIARPFLDADQLVVAYANEGTWGTGLLSAAGEITPVEPWPNAYPAVVWPAD